MTCKHTHKDAPENDICEDCKEELFMDFQKGNLNILRKALKGDKNAKDKL